MISCRAAAAAALRGDSLRIGGLRVHVQHRCPPQAPKNLKCNCGYGFLLLKPSYPVRARTGKLAKNSDYIRTTFGLHSDCIRTAFGQHSDYIPTTTVGPLAPSRIRRGRLPARAAAAAAGERRRRSSAGCRRAAPVGLREQMVWWWLGLAGEAGGCDVAGCGVAGCDVMGCDGVMVGDWRPPRHRPAPSARALSSAPAALSPAPLLSRRLGAAACWSRIPRCAAVRRPGVHPAHCTGINDHHRLGGSCGRR